MRPVRGTVKVRGGCYAIQAEQVLQETCPNAVTKAYVLRLHDNSGAGCDVPRLLGEVLPQPGLWLVVGGVLPRAWVMVADLCFLEGFFL